MKILFKILLILTIPIVGYSQSTKISLSQVQDISTATICGRNTAGSGSIEQLSASTTKTLLSLNNVENTALSTWAGTTNITTLGTITTGVWTGTDIAYANIAQGSGLSVLGVTGTSTADLVSITGTADQVLRVNTAGTSLGFGTITSAGITDATISNTDLASGVGGIYKGSGTISGSTVGTLATSASLNIGYSTGGNYGIGVSDISNTAFISGQSGDYTAYANNSTSGLTGPSSSSWSMGSTYALTGTASVAATNTATDRLVIQTNSTGTATTNFGGGILFQGESSTTNDRDMSKISSIWSTATDASRTSSILFSGVFNAGSIGEYARFTSATGAPTMRIASAVGTAGGTDYSNSGITSAVSYTVGNSSNTLTLGGSTGFTVISSASTSGIAIRPTEASTTGGGLTIGQTISHTYTSGNKNFINIADGYTPTSGTGTWTSFNVGGTMNQTGGSSGIVKGIAISSVLTAIADYKGVDYLPSYTASSGTGSTTGFSYTSTLNLTSTHSGTHRGIYINPTLTALVSAGQFKAVDIAANSSNAIGIYQSGSSTINNIVGGTTFGSTTAPNAAAAIDVISTTKGVKLPVMTNTQRDAISSPPEGLIIYSSDNDAINLYDGSSIWKRISTKRTVLKTADETVNNSSTFQTDDALTFTAKANKKYVITYHLYLTDTDWTSGMKGRIVASGATTVRAFGEFYQDTDTNVQPYDQSGGTGYLFWAAAILHFSDLAHVVIKAYVNPGASDRTVNLEWAQDSAGVRNSIVKEGSWMEYEEIN